ncbi:DUF6197 family protein [Streptomyces sp. NPDC002125]
MNHTLAPSQFTSPDIRPSGFDALPPEPVPETAAEPPPWSHRLLPPFLRRVFADLGLWQDPTPQPPSVHLEQTLAVLRQYGWCQSVDTTPTGRLCIRGAQNVLEKTGHTTPAGRERAVAYMQQALAQAGVHMQFFAWNDLPDQQFPAVQQLLTRAAGLARQNGE